MGTKKQNFRILLVFLGIKSFYCRLDVKYLTINKRAIRIHILVITLNGNRLNSPTKTHNWLNGY